MGKFALFALTLGALAHPARSADDLIGSELVDQAREWQQKNRDDLAADLWRKLLRFNPQHPEALVKLGVIEARAGNLSAAEELYNRANQLAKPPVGLNQLSVAVKAKQSSLPNSALTPSKSKPEPSQSAPTRSEVSKPAVLMKAEPVDEMTQKKPIELKVIAPTADVSKKKTQAVAVGAASATKSSEKPVQKTEVDALNLMFSTSMEIDR